MTYRKDPRMNASTLKMYLDHDHKVAQHKRDNPTPPTDAMLFGTLVHGILELGHAPPEFAISEFKDFRTKEARAWKAEQEANGVHIIKQADLDRAYDMAMAVRNSVPPEIQYLIKEGLPEQAFYTETEKALLDVVCNGVGVDYKTTLATSEQQFVRECYKYHYPLQAAHYVDVAQLDAFYFIGVSHTAPHPVWCLKCSPSFLEFGREEKARAYKAMEQTEEFGKTIEVDSPKWWTKTEDEDMSI